MRAFILRRVGLDPARTAGSSWSARRTVRDTLRLQRVPESQRLSASPARHRARCRGGRLPRLLLAHAPTDLPVVIAARPAACCAIRRTPQLADDARPDRDASTRPVSTTWRWSAPVRPGWRPRSTPLRKGCSTIVRRGHGARRPGRHQLEDRELPRLPDRHLGPGAGRPGAGAGAEVRCAAGDLARRRRPRVRRGALRARASTTARRCSARAVVIATGARYRKLDVADYERFEGAGHPLRGDRHGGAAVRAARR